MLLLAAQLAFAGFGEINGYVTEEASGEPVFNAYISVEIDSQIIYQAVTDENGFFVIKLVESGLYDIKVSYVSFNTQVLKDIRVSDGQIRRLDFKMSPLILEGAVVTYYTDLVDPGYTGTISIIPATQIEQAPASPIDFISVVTPSAFQEDYGAPIQFRGARTDATLYIIDGVKIIGEPVIVRNSVEDMLIYTGGIPARYGDATGGIIVVTTKNYKLR